MNRFAAAAACAAVGTVVLVAAQQTAATAGAELRNAGGEVVGEVSLKETPHGVLVRATLKNLPSGWHGFHVHETGTCEPPFTSAGGHFNPGQAQHGLENPKGRHAGDMPNVYVPEGGEATVELLATGLSLSAGAASLLDADGSAIVLHAQADDYTSDPAGNAGPRLACGVVTR